MDWLKDVLEVTNEAKLRERFLRIRLTHAKFKQIISQSKIEGKTFEVM